MPKVSVIVPNYNHANFLEKRLESILNQTFQDFELIILDDCSNDRSKEVIEQYRAHRKVSYVIFNNKNTGSPFSQWRKGVDLAMGKYIWIAESDDFADSSFLEKTVDILDSQHDVSLVYTQSYIIDENSNVLRSNYPWTADLDSERWYKNYINDGREESIKFLTKKNIIPNASAVLFRKVAIKEDITWPVNMKMLGDWFFWIQLISTNKIAYISECLNYFRETSQTTRVHDSFFKMRTRLLEELLVLYKNYKINDIPKVGVRKEYYRLFKKILNLCVAYKKPFSFVKFLVSSTNIKLTLIVK